VNLFSELKRRNVLRVAAAYIVTSWLIVQVVETLFPVYGLSEAAIRLVVNILAIVMIPVLVVSWFFEITPEGLRRETELLTAGPAPRHATRKIDRAILAVLAVAVIYFALDKFVLDPRREASQRQKQAEKPVKATEEARQQGRSEAFVESYGDLSIAVLPFRDMSPNGDQEYLSDGIAEELLTVLA